MRKLFYLAVYLFGAKGLIAQETVNGTSAFRRPKISEGEGAVFLQAGLPSKDMKELTRNNMFGDGFGASVLYVSNPAAWGRNNSNSPIRIGGELGYTYYGRFITEVDINGEKGDFKTSYGIAHLNAVLRFRHPEVVPVVPFFDLFAGGNFYLSTVKENLDAIESSLGLPGFNFGGTSSASFVKGVAAGLMIGSENTDQARFTLRVSYTRGRSLQYIVRNSLAYDANYNSLTYMVGKAPVEYILVQFGIGL